MKRGTTYTPTVNIDRLWSLVPEGVYEKSKAGSELTPVIDVTKLVSTFFCLNVKPRYNISKYVRVTLKSWAKESCQTFPLLLKPDISVKM